MGLNLVIEGVKLRLFLQEFCFVNLFGKLFFLKEHILDLLQHAVKCRIQIDNLVRSLKLSADAKVSRLYLVHQLHGLIEGL